MKEKKKRVWIPYKIWDETQWFLFKKFKRRKG